MKSLRTLPVDLELFRNLDRGILIVMLSPEDRLFTPIVSLRSPDRECVLFRSMYIVPQDELLVRRPAIPPPVPIACRIGMLLALELATPNGMHRKDTGPARWVVLVLHPARAPGTREVLVPAAAAAHPRAEPVLVQRTADGNADAHQCGTHLGGVPDDDADDVLEVVGAAEVLELDGALDAAGAGQHAEAHGEADDELLAPRHVEVPQQPPGEGRVEEVDDDGPAPRVRRDGGRVDRARPVEPPVPQVGDRDAGEPEHEERGDDGRGQEEVGHPDGDLVTACRDESEEE